MTSGRHVTPLFETTLTPVRQAWDAVAALAEPPIDVGREEAARAARDELAKAIYHRDEPGVVSRILLWAYHELRELLGTLAALSPGGSWGLLALVLVLALVALVIRWRAGALARSRATSAPAVFAEARRTAAEHRAAADAAAARADYSTAVRERFRALARELEERAILDERPARTADEVAREVAAVAPDTAGLLRAAARAFDDVCYGGRRATREADAHVRAADDAVRRIRRTAAVSSP
jgi:hypothetical protein